MTRQRGISLIELIMFIVIVSVALAGILLVLNVATKSSADPLVHKQALAIAESLLEEVELMPFTYCEPDDPAATTATSTALCNTVEGLGPETDGGTLETRYAAPNFDNVNDYDGCQMNTGVANPRCDSTGTGGIKDITNTAITALNGYTASIAVTKKGLALGLPTDDVALLVTVTVTGKDGLPVVMEGIRTRYSPNDVP
jgi:MSHA pilin protein MshD